MFGFPLRLKTAAVAGLGALAITIAAAAPASAHQRSFVRCNYYGNHCVRFVCDRDGDRCRRVAYFNRERERHYRYDRRHRDDRYHRRDRHDRYDHHDRDRHYRPVSGGFFIGLNLYP
jgi:hypothetical protein